MISLGIPINLDEVLPHANGRGPLPALNVSTRPSSVARSGTPVNGSPRSTAPSRAGTPQPTKTATGSLGLGPKPKLNQEKNAEFLGLETGTQGSRLPTVSAKRSPDSLTLLPLPILESHLATLRSLTAEASGVLTHLLQTRDALQQDSETYNGLIAELVGEAQKTKIAQRGRTAAKRSSAFT